MGIKSGHNSILISAIIGIVTIGLFLSLDVFAENEEFKIPDWIKNVAGMWHDKRIGDETFVGTLQWLITNEIIILPTTDAEKVSSNEVPTWVRNNAGWWASGQIDDKTFVNGLQYLIKIGLIQLEPVYGGGY